jgi:hypothetical protein
MSDFGWALEQMREGRRVKRAQFKDTCWVRIQYPEPMSLNNLPYLQMVKMRDPKGDVTQVSVFPCTLSCESLLATDWEIVEVSV